MHDTLEDGADSEEERQVLHREIESTFGDDIASAVSVLTKRPKSDFDHLPKVEAKREREKEYMARVAEATELVRLVKVLDRINNLLCVHKSPSKIEGYIEETITYHMPLAATVDSVLVEEMAYVIEGLRKKFEDEERKRQLRLWTSRRGRGTQGRRTRGRGTREREHWVATAEFVGGNKGQGARERHDVRARVLRSFLRFLPPEADLRFAPTG